MVKSRTPCICSVGRNDTQVAVMVYGAKSAVAVTWRDEQTQDNLLKLLESLHGKTDNQPRLGKHADTEITHTIRSDSSNIRPAKLTRVLIPPSLQELLCDWPYRHQFPPPAGQGWASLKLWLWW